MSQPIVDELIRVLNEAKSLGVKFSGRELRRLQSVCQMVAERNTLVKLHGCIIQRAWREIKHA